MIRLENILCSYPDFILNVDFSVESDEILTLLGHSGSGKTTTLRILAGFEKSDTGRILLDERDVTALPPQKRDLGYVFQDYTLFPHLDVGRNVAYGLRVKKVPAREQERRVRELLDLVGLEGFENRAVHTLSGGEQQRVAVARALAPGPRGLLLDEPFSAIDTERRESLRRHLVRVQRELRIPTVFVTHSRTEALFLSDRIILLREGSVEDSGRPEDLYERPRTEYAARFLGSANILPRDRVKEVLRDVPDTPSTALMIRPEHVVLSESGPIRARVGERAYYGAWYEYTLETELGPLQAVSGVYHETGTILAATLPPEHLVPLLTAR